MRCQDDGSIRNFDCSSMSYFHIEHNPLMHMVAPLDSSLELSLFFDAHWLIASFLVVDCICQLDDKIYCGFNLKFSAKR